jgi:beta-galactosidase
VDLTAYELVIVPTLLLVSDDSAQNIASVVSNGGTVVVTYLSGVVDENDRVRPGGYPGAFSNLLRTAAEEHFPLLDGEIVLLDSGASATEWTELMRESGDADVMARYASGALAGYPAITCSRDEGQGAAWYVSANLDYASVKSMVDEITSSLQITGPRAPEGIEAIRRHHPGVSFLFLTNHTSEPLEVKADGVELITGKLTNGSQLVPPGEVRVVREEL